MTPSELKLQVAKLPTNSGIYIFRDTRGKPLYIGKALNLKNRLKSYLKTSNPRITQMILEAKKIECIETQNEIEALILESQYIKKYRPDFNIRLRDGTQYSYVGFTNEKFPKIFITHQPTEVSSIKYQVLRDGENQKKILNTKYVIHNTDFIGPFTDAGALKTTLRLLRRIFPYCTCKQTHHNYCLNYHIGKCLGFCCLKNPELRITDYVLRIYEKNIKAIKDILSGKKTSLIKDLEKEMKILSGKQEFEKAIELKYKIEKLKRVFENAQVLNTGYLILNTENDKDRTVVLKQLAKVIGMDHPPLRIECYDIANIQGKYAVGAMAVFTNGVPDKNEYRKFKIYTKSSPDDTAMLREILTRRFNHPEWPMPDLILVDGGKPQFNAARNVVKNIPIIALTKNERHIGEKIFIENKPSYAKASAGKKEAMPLYKLPPEVKNLLLHLDSEAHRFAISYYRKLHRKSLR